MSYLSQQMSLATELTTFYLEK